MRNNWRIKDLIDLEYFLGKKFGETADATETDDLAFDRNAYRSFPGRDTWKDTPAFRRQLVRHWLEARRAIEKRNAGAATLLPGDAYSEAMRTIRFLVAGLALLLGAGVTMGLLSYSGREPVNVFTCLWVLLVPQALLLIALFLSATAHRMKLTGSFKLVYPLLTALFSVLLRKIGRFAGKRMDADRSNRFREIFALLGKTKTIYGSVFFWPVFLLAQLFGLFYNAGILGAFFLKITITDLAFGWQTTLKVAPESILRFVEVAALPWSWLFSPPLAHPMLEQIAGSKMILKDGIFHLATGDLVSWWPFIFLAVLFYGFLPRLLLAAAGYILKRRALSAITFNHGTCDRLVTRMKTPRIETKSTPYRMNSAASLSDPVAETGAGKKGAGETPAIVVVPEEIHDQVNRAWLDQYLGASLGMHPAAVIPASMDAASDARMLRQALLEKGNSSFSTRIVVLQEAWQPPIRENMAWIKALRSAAGGTAGMVIALLGQPGDGRIPGPPSEMDRKIWSQAVALLKDPYMRTEPIGGQPVD